MQKCLQITQKMIKWPMCSPFVQMVDPERDGAPNYFDIIKEPMALTKVVSKIQAHEYDSVDDWKRDVNLIWSNARKYNDPDSFFVHMANESSRWFNEKTKDFPATQEEEWTAKMQKTTKKLLHFLSHPPSDIDPSGFVKDAIKQDKEDRKI